MSVAGPGPSRCCTLPLTESPGTPKYRCRVKPPPQPFFWVSSGVKICSENPGRTGYGRGISNRFKD